MSNKLRLNEQEATEFPNNFNDGFSKPSLGWSAYGAQYLEGIGGSSMTSNVWIGKPAEVLSFIEILAAHYTQMVIDMQDDQFDAEENNVALAYWEKDGLAMIGEFCVGDMFFEAKTEEIYTAAGKLTWLLVEGNDNDAGHILINEVECEPLDAPTRLTLAHFMNTSVEWVFKHEDRVPGFSMEDQQKLHDILNARPATAASYLESTGP